MFTASSSGTAVGDMAVIPMLCWPTEFTRQEKTEATVKQEESVYPVRRWAGLKTNRQKKQTKLRCTRMPVTGMWSKVRMEPRNEDMD